MSWLFKYKDNLRIWLVVAILTILIMPLLPSQQVYAKDPPGKRIEIEKLGKDEVRLNTHTKAKKTGEFIEGNKTLGRWKAEISSLPQTFPDLKTKITIEWRMGQSSDGVVYYETGNNLFYSRVTGTRVSVEGEGRLAAWDPILYLNDDVLRLKEGPTLIRDPRNTDYGYNTIGWVYEKPGGFLVPTITIIRYVRQIEGSLQEYYVLNKNPNANFKVVNRYQEEKGFKWVSELSAYDSAGKPLKIVGNKEEKIVTAKELDRPDIKYPVIVDPTTTFIGSYKDLGLFKQGASYSTAWGATSSDGYFSSSLFIGQIWWEAGGFIEIERSALFFDTSALPDTAIISGAQLSLYSNQKDVSSTLTAALQIQTGMPTYPRDPVVMGDFNKALYSGLGLVAEQWFEYIVVNSYNTFTLSNDGISWINKVGWTKFMARSTQDINGVSPGSGLYRVGFYQAEAGAGREPQLIVTYDMPVTIPVIDTRTAESVGGTFATLRGYLTDDGGAPSDVKFEYGITTSYGTPTFPESGKVTGDSWSTLVPGLQYGTLYHYTARAENSGGTSTADDQTFLTMPDRPTGFSATPGNQQNSLSWTKGTGSTNTMIRRDTTGFPTTVTSGTQVYFSTGTSVVDTGRTNGVTYYYSAWAEKTDSGWQQYSADYVMASGMPYVAGPPGVTTNAATLVTQSSATLNGYLDSLGGYASADVRFQYYWGAGSWADNDTTYETKTTTDSFTSPISGLPADTLIHVRTQAVGTGGSTNGNDVPFTTGAVSAPTMQTVSAIATGTGATLYGKVINDGGAPVTVRFDWGLTTSYGQETGTAPGLLTGASFNVVLTGLTFSTTYNFRAVGWNSAGTGYGNNTQFTTLSPSAPTVTASSATDIGASSARLHGQLDTDGGVATDVRFQWSSNATLETGVTSSGWQTGKRTGDTFSSYATNLTILTTYYFRAQAQNSGGSVNSTILSFTTVFTAPTNFRATPWSSTSITLSWTPQSDKTLIIARTGAFPADRLDGKQAFFGTGGSATYGSLIAGTTYYFRAWSWRDGDIYSSAYAEDAATTTSGARVGEVETPKVNETKPGIPSGWFGDPSSSKTQKFQKWPSVGLIDSTAAQIGMPNGEMWIIVAGLIVILVSIAASSYLPLSITAIVAGAFAIFVLSVVGVIPLWIIAPYIIVGGGFLYLIKSGGM